MKFTVDWLGQDGEIATQYTADAPRAQTSPPFALEDIDPTARCLLLDMTDPNDPAGERNPDGGWNHFRTIEEVFGDTRFRVNTGMYAGDRPDIFPNSWGNTRWEGPASTQPGARTYEFLACALKIPPEEVREKLNPLYEGNAPQIAEILKTLVDNVIGEPAKVIGRYTRERFRARMEEN